MVKSAYSLSSLSTYSADCIDKNDNQYESMYKQEAKIIGLAKALKHRTKTLAKLKKRLRLEVIDKSLVVQEKNILKAKLKNAKQKLQAAEKNSKKEERRKKQYDVLKKKMAVLKKKVVEGNKSNASDKEKPTANLNDVSSCSCGRFDQKIEKIENELTCSICFEFYIKPITLNCSHTYCQYCISEWKKKKRSNQECPICRKRIKTFTRCFVIENMIDGFVNLLDDEARRKRVETIKDRESMTLALAGQGIIILIINIIIIIIIIIIIKYNDCLNN